ncbi:unnamed protein product [Boreogadus saida]
METRAEPVAVARGHAECLILSGFNHAGLCLVAPRCSDTIRDLMCCNEDKYHSAAAKFAYGKCGRSAAWLPTAGLEERLEPVMSPHANEPSWKPGSDPHSREGREIWANTSNIWNRFSSLR